MAAERSLAPLCERCRERPWDDLWSPDGLVGHEILVCGDCLRELDSTPVEVENYRCRIDSFVRGRDV